ncbi:MAG: glycosyltransferase family 4 protein [Thermoflexales bacterium]|nr:glycosyltransferase family 4 protein [Thermoflexales bacterium]
MLYSAFDVVPSPKGASTHITYFTRGLVEAGYHVQLVTAGDPALPERDSYCGAQVLRVPVGDDLNYLRRALAFGQAVLRHVESSLPYSIAHFRSIWEGWALVQAQPRWGYKTLFEVNGLPGIELKYHYPELKDDPLLAKIKRQEIVTLLLADRIICPSAVTRAYIASLGVPREKISVIQNGVDTRLFTPQPIKEAARSPTLLYIGTLADWQGLDVLVEATRILAARRTVRLRIVGHGRGRQRKELLKRVRKLGLAELVSVEAAVPHHAMPALLAQADVCIAPLSYNDRNVTQGCCPLKLIEYMACGRPIVASNLPVVRELAREDVDALLFTPDDPADLARCIQAILDNPALAQGLAASAAGRAHTAFSWHAAQKKLLKVYSELLR